MLEDAARALRLVRANAADWKVDPKRIGIMGSSAGGHLASTLLTHFDAGKPDAADLSNVKARGLIWAFFVDPVITMGQFTHQGSKMQHPRQGACAGFGQIALERTASGASNAADVPLAHLRRHSGAGGEQSRIYRRFAQERSSVRPSRLPARQTWPRPGQWASLDQGLSLLAESAGLCQTGSLRVIVIPANAR